MKFKKLPNQTSFATKRQLIEYLRKAEIALIEAGKEDAAFYFEMLRDSLDIKMDKGEFLFQQKDLGL
tara:strand:+ start:656 stop:856 length:201 start_codon:yes stop_codon:yes gene_type:complete